MYTFIINCISKIELTDSNCPWKTFHRTKNVGTYNSYKKYLYSPDISFHPYGSSFGVQMLLFFWHCYFVQISYLKIRIAQIVKPCNSWTY